MALVFLFAPGPGSEINKALCWAGFLKEGAMQALQKRRERWEYENQRRLERVLTLTQQQLQVQFRFTGQLMSFLLYLAYGGGRWLVRASRILWVYPRNLDQRLQDAEQQRLNIAFHPSSWLK